MSKDIGSGFIVKGLPGMPVQIPLQLLQAQKELGFTAAMVWINMAMFVQQHRPINVNLISEVMDLDSREVNLAMARLADQGWINDEGYEIKLCIPETKKTIELIGQNKSSTETHSILDPKQKGFEWLINHYATRVKPPTPEEMKKLLFWVEKKGISYEVIAVAIEEMCVSIDSPHFAYLEGVLRNWVNEGVLTYTQLMDKPYLAKVIDFNHKSSIHPAAAAKWKEFFPDEFDS